MEPVPGVEKSTVRKYLDTHGEGFHHLSFKSDNLSEDIERMKGEGVKIIGEGFPIVFTHPKTTGGTVLEITEQDD